MSERTQLLVTELSNKFPELEGVFKEHLQDNGRVLPHVLMADYCRLVLKTDSMKLWIESLLDELEKNFSLLDDDVSNVIAVSFVEHLPSLEQNHWVVERLGKKMRKQYNIFFKIG